MEGDEKVVDDTGVFVEGSGMRAVSLLAFWGSEGWIPSALVIEKISQSRSSLLIKVIESLTACACHCGHIC